MIKKLPISCIIRTYNEERMIDKVLQNVTELFDDIVIVDSGSTDKTCSIIEKYDVRLFKNEWPGFGFQKRFAEEKSKYNWIFALDADELLSPELKVSIRDVFNKENQLYNVYFINEFFIMPSGKVFRNSYKYKFPRLYNKKFYRAPKSKIWDNFAINEKDAGKLKGELWHWTFASYTSLIDKYNIRSQYSVKATKKRNKIILALRILFGFPLYFSKKYFLKGLWLEGLDGFIFSFIVGLGRWMRDIKMWEENQLNKVSSDKEILVKRSEDQTKCDAKSS